MNHCPIPYQGIIAALCAYIYTKKKYNRMMQVLVSGFDIAH